MLWNCCNCWTQTVYSNLIFHGVNVLYWLHSWRTVSLPCTVTQAVMDERFWCVLQAVATRYVSQRLFSKPASPMPCTYPMHTQHLLCVHPAHTYQSSTKLLQVLLLCPMAAIMYSWGTTLVVTTWVGQFATAPWKIEKTLLVNKGTLLNPISGVPHYL